MKSLNLLFLLLPLLLLLLSTPSKATTFNCTGAKTATCQSLIGYSPSNSTTLHHIQSFFQVGSLPLLLGANNLPLTTPSSHSIPANSTVLVPVPCTCSNGTGRSDHIQYTVQKTDQGLDFIARTVFDQFVTYQEIAAFNGIVNVNIIDAGQKLLIPLPCSCDMVGGEEVVHLAHIVAAGSSVSGIAEEFGTTSQVVIELNGISDPKSLEAGQVLDVPLKACSSSINKTSLDHNLLVPNGSYALTADDCIQCSCSSSTYQLSCKSSIKGQSKASTCPVPTCGNNLFLGNSTGGSGCDLTTCSYTGYYTNSSGLSITASLTTNPSLCNNASSPAPSVNPQPSGGTSAGNRLRVMGYRGEFLLVLQFALFCSSIWG